MIQSHVAFILSVENKPNPIQIGLDNVGNTLTAKLDSMPIA